MYLVPKNIFSKIMSISQALVALTCNLSYSGSRDQEAHGLKPARQIVFETLS
jgi:hypothetical protein